MNNDSKWNDDEEEKDEPWKRDHDAWKSGGQSDSTGDPAVSSGSLKDEAPVWNEDRWERFIHQMDKSGRHIIAYYEKFWNFAERDRMVEEALALYCVREAFREMYPGHQKEYYLRFYLLPELLDMGLNAMDYQDFFHAKERTLSKQYPFRVCRDFYRQCKYWFLGLPGHLRSDMIKEGVLHHALIVCTKIAGGHIMGYQPFTIGGNIVLCRMALREMQSAGVALRAVYDAGLMNEANYDYLSKSRHEAKNKLAFRIVELRDKLTPFLF